MSASSYESRKARFDEFLSHNPHVYGEIVARARRAKERGHRLGMRCLWEVLRYDWSVGIWHAPDDFKLNDHFAPLLARLIDSQEEDLRGYFDFRGHAESRSSGVTNG